ncbi:LETM1 and EF-hand domain-containing protein 1, mitochondrial-like [Gossypium australe]|uniref:LETM1 and EF-hand domain-containing protein 1, mitochondrial-like n=1 Tax=Gossypium australe TaxID=47621 RepID=A0A5B6XAM8_9ROSI|nr:LETM1 and EF-hand domain-containing protein 1, mitochondrial-like [Gossypium australe]
MASRVILRRRSYIFNSPTRLTSLIRGFSSFEHRQSFTSEDSQGSPYVASHPYPSSDFKKVVLPSVLKNELSYFLAAQYHRSNSSGISNSGYLVGNLEFKFPLEVRWFSQSVRSASTSTAGKPELGGSSDGKEQQASKKVKEASPEECDQAVEGLSTVKAKAKAKQVQDSTKSGQSLIKKLWAMILGIGPALRAVASMSREDWAKKLRHWKDEFKSTMQHYWLGTKLLWADIRISSRLLVKLASGKGLSRRERQQLTRTTADIFRLVPFAVFIIVPFMEFLLPVFLKLFPNMLPSTFQDKMKEQEALKRRLNARIEYAKFLQDTVKEMAKEIQNSRSGDVKKTAEDLAEFMNKVRTGAGVSNDEILGFAKLFNDELTLDNISRLVLHLALPYCGIIPHFISSLDVCACSFLLNRWKKKRGIVMSFSLLHYLMMLADSFVGYRPRLVNMCKYMGISPYGTDAYLRYMLRKRLQEIKNDDKMIQAEGVESLSEAELRQACRERGLLGLLSVEEMRQQLRDWLDLSLNHSVPSSLLILSRAFTVSGKVRPEEAVQATLSSLPDEVVDTVGVTALPSEDSVSERRRKLEFLEMQEELIKEEEEEEEEEQAKLKESISKQKDVALEELAVSTAKEAQELAKAKTLEKHEQLCELSRALAVLASASSVSWEREEFLRLVKKEVELYNSMVEKEGTEDEEEAKKAYKAAREHSDHTAQKAIGDKVSSALIDRVSTNFKCFEHN